MKRQHFKIDINATPGKVWDVLWNSDTYREWTNVFCEGSYMESDWKVGGKTRFLSPGNSGMYSTIAELEEGKYVAFKHLGEIREGVEQEMPEWSNAIEAYRVTDNGDMVELSVEMDTTEEYEQYFRDTFPKGLEKVKELAER